MNYTIFFYIKMFQIYSSRKKFNAKTVMAMQIRIITKQVICMYREVQYFHKHERLTALVHECSQGANKGLGAGFIKHVGSMVHECNCLDSTYNICNLVLPFVI